MNQFILSLFITPLAYAQSGLQLNNYLDVKSTSATTEIFESVLAVGQFQMWDLGVLGVSPDQKWALIQSNTREASKERIRLVKIHGVTKLEATLELKSFPELDAHPVFKGDFLYYTEEIRNSWNSNFGPGNTPSSPLLERVKLYQLKKYNLVTGETTTTESAMTYKGRIITPLSQQTNSYQIEFPNGKTEVRDEAFLNSVHFDLNFRYGLTFLYEKIRITQPGRPEQIIHAQGIMGDAVHYFSDSFPQDKDTLFLWSDSRSKIYVHRLNQPVSNLIGQQDSYMGSPRSIRYLGSFLDQADPVLAWLIYDQHTGRLVVWDHQTKKPKLTELRIPYDRLRSAYFPKGKPWVCYSEKVLNLTCFDYQKNQMIYSVSVRGLNLEIQPRSSSQTHRIGPQTHLLVHGTEIKLIKTTSVQVPKISIGKPPADLTQATLIQKFLDFNSQPTKVIPNIYKEGLQSLELNYDQLVQHYQKVLTQKPKSGSSARAQYIDQNLLDTLPNELWGPIKQLLAFHEKLTDPTTQIPNAKLITELPAPARDLLMRINFPEKKLIVEKMKSEALAIFQGFKTPNSHTYLSFNSAKDTLNLISTLVHLFSETEREEFADWMADRVVEAAMARDPLVGQMFSSKVYKFAYNALLPLFHLKQKNLMDITVTLDQSTKRLQLLRLSAHPENQGQINQAGFYSKILTTLDSRDYEELFEQNFRWRSKTQQFYAQVQIRKDAKASTIVTEKLSPAYDDYLKDKIFKGVVMVGSNMSQGSALVENYIQYYEEMGFTFDQPVQIPSSREYLKNQVEGTEPMDYFVKEAHSDGDEKNLFRIPMASILRRGEKKQDGYTEVVELLHGNPANNAAELISNQDFAKWLQTRLTNHGTELFYLNGSCWSDKKALFEVAAARTPKFLNIPSTTITYTFSKSPTNGMRALIHSLREQKDFAGIREELEKSKYYPAKTGDRYIFPDEREYKDKITNYLPENVDIQIKIQKSMAGKWKAYSLDHHVDENLN